MSFRRFQVLGELPPDFRDRFTEGIARNVFRENDKARTKDDNLGWVSATDPDDIELHLNKFLFNNVLVLAMRVDRKRLPARYFRIQVDKKVREEKLARGLDRLGPIRKKELKEAVEEELLGRALPVVATFDMAWDITSSQLWLFTTSDPICDLFRGLFKLTFDLEVQRIRLCDWLDGVLPPEEVMARANGLQPEQGWRG